MEETAGKVVDEGERVRLYEQLGGHRPAISQAATLSEDLSLSVQNGSPIDLDTAKE